VIKIATILGARPQFVKASILSQLFKLRKDFKEIIIHTGQHYDFEMSEIFFKQLNIPKPHYNLGIKSNFHGEMTGKMIIEIEKVLLKIKPNFTIVYGDTNSTLAGALASNKLGIQVVHIEAGLRSFNKKMPEEINRVLTDHCSSYFFVPSNLSRIQLLKENIKDENIFLVGDVMFDLYLSLKKKIENISKKIKKNYVDKFILVTFHRAENIKSIKKIRNIISNFSDLSKKIKIIFLIHPATKKKLNKYKLYKKLKKIVYVMKPQGYIQTMALLKNCRLLITDSGGMQKEAFYSKIPCLTLRDETEWPETLRNGFNKLVNIKNRSIYKNAIKSLNLNSFKNNASKVKMIYGAGNASQLIIKKLKILSTNNKLK
jgi:UDP-N-acetylglucosamine 2-epimerase